ncbi:HdeA/HdeB family chaperone [Pseudomonas fragi]|uniref:HdeA/HdeB family chaperone n=1 Tax=Pseudomonas fragi TaxID=296 RepID=UPI0014759914|nr:HdeA/HdeB family chaperone [Pseudomonas fragi]NNB18110.1 hypothetical protein [Pseudomonas fragi]NNB22990.1 hypothetical protein [Pseudomonas fragi]
MKAIIIFGLAAATFALVAQAAKSNNTYSVIGYGNTTCVQLLGANNEDYAALNSWVNGYLTGVNAFSPLTLKGGWGDIEEGVEPGARKAWLSRWCTTHLNDKVETAAQMYVKDRAKQLGL